VDGQHDGLLHRNVLASYAHLRSLDENGWARHFVDFVRARRQTDRQGMEKEPGTQAEVAGAET
jgi:hypothetical protein